MGTLKEQNKLRINKAYDLTKFALKTKPREKKVTEIFEEVARELGYENSGRVANIYYQMRKEDPERLGEFKTKTKNNSLAYEE